MSKKKCLTDLRFSLSRSPTSFTLNEGPAALGAVKARGARLQRQL